jgi:hypothetical protein
MSTRENTIKRQQREKTKEIQANIQFVRIGIYTLGVVWIALLAGIIIIGTKSITLKDSITSLEKYDETASKEKADILKNFKDTKDEVKCLRDARYGSTDNTPVCKIKEVSLNDTLQGAMDTNLCSTDNGGCDINADCSVKDGGSVFCRCKSGYLGDGKTCDDCTLPNQEFKGITTLDTPFQAVDWQQCRSYCLREKTCVVWSFYGSQYPSEEAEYCKLYAEYVKPSKQDRITSGYANCENADLLKQFWKVKEEHEKFTTESETADDSTKVIQGFASLEPTFPYAVTSGDDSCVVKGPGSGDTTAQGYHGTLIIKISQVVSPAACSAKCGTYSECTGWSQQMMACELYKNEVTKLTFIKSFGPFFMSGPHRRFGMSFGPTAPPPWSDGLRSCLAPITGKAPRHIPGLQSSFTGFGCHVKDCKTYPVDTNFKPNATNIDACAEACFDHEPIVHEFTFNVATKTCHCHLFDASNVSPFYNMYEDSTKANLKYVIS